MSVGLCQEDDDEPVVDEVTDKAVVKGVVEVCQPRHQKHALLCINMK